MKSFLVDLAVIASSFAAAEKCHDPPASRIMTDVDAQALQHAALDVGDTVEVFDTRIHPHLAFLGKIERIEKGDDCSVKYDVRAGPMEDEIVRQVDRSSVRLHEEYDMDTPIMIDKGNSLRENSHLEPHTIVTLDSSGVEDKYLVMNVGHGGCMEFEPSRIRRVVDLSAYPADHFKPRRQPDGLTGMVGVYYKDTEMPALVTGCKVNDPDMVSVKDTFTGSLIFVKREEVHPYRLCKEGSWALCNVDGGNLDKSDKSRDLYDVDFFQCMIESHFVDPRDGVVQYHISYMDREGNEASRDLTFKMVQCFSHE